MPVQCDYCNSTGQLYVPDMDYVVDCHYCAVDRRNALIQRHTMRTRAGEPVDEAFLAMLHRSGIISTEINDLAHTDITPTLLSGASGTGKTLLLRTWYNRTLQLMGGHKERVIFFTEKELVDIFRDEERAIQFFRKMQLMDIRYAFLDEMLDPINWMDRKSDRHYAILKHSNLWRFIDDLYESNAIVVMATNTDPITGTLPNGQPLYDMHNEHDAKIVRRILEMTGSGNRWKALNNRRVYASSK